MAMYKPPRWTLAFIITVVFTSACLLNTDCWAATNKDLHRDQILVLGKVSDNPRKHFRRLKPMADYLASHLGDMGIVKSDVLLAANNEQMIQYLREGRIDYVTESVVSSALFIQQANAVPLVRKWKSGTPTYQSLIFVRKDSAIHSLPDLLGKRIALEDTGSTTAFFIPVAAFYSQGLTVTPLPSPREKAPTDVIGSYITNDDTAISPLVYGGVVDAGALSSIDWQKRKRVPTHHRDAFRIIYRSQPWPRSLELVGAHIGANLSLRIKEILLQAHSDPNARSALVAYQKTSKFDELKDNDWTALAEARNVLSIIKRGE